MSLLLLASLALAQTEATLTFSAERGWYDAPFQVVLTSDAPTVRYTLDGTAPTASVGTEYTAPIDVIGTTLLRAVACDEACTPVHTHSYLFMSEVLAQSAPADLPTLWGEDTPADYEMDPDVVGDGLVGPLLSDALTALPTLSLVLPPDDLWHASTGIYMNSREQGVLWERAASVEWIADESWQVGAGLRLMGGSSRAPAKAPKHSLRLLFKSAYGPSRLERDLFGGDALDSFDTLALRAGYNRSWTHWVEIQRRRAQYTRDRWAMDSQRAMGHPGPHARFVHTYLNGLYWGVYNLHERPSAAFLSDTWGGSKEEWDAINAGDPVDGDLVAWTTLLDLVDADLTQPEHYAQVEQYLDIDSLITHIVLNHWGANTDWDDRNWYTGRRRADGEGFKFFVWDSELMLVNVNTDVTGTSHLGGPTELHHALSASPEYRLRFADHVHDWMFQDGPLTDAVALARYEAIADELELAIVAESARWGDYRRDVLQEGPPYDLYGPSHWETERSRLRTLFFPGRTAFVLGRYEELGLYPTLDAPEVSPAPGRYPSGQVVTLTNPDGVGSLWVTTDGTDPRLPGGDLSPSAVEYTAALTLTESVDLFARVRDGETWSARVRAAYLLDQDDSGLVINELHYHPEDGEAAEFLEITNVGPEVDLQGLAIAGGVQFAFEQSVVLAAGGYLVLTDNPEAFEAAYGFAAYGTYDGQLKNSGETVQIVEGERVIDSVTWGDDPPWPTLCDGDGPSLELADPALDNDLAASWGASRVDEGTPGAENSLLWLVDTGDTGTGSDDTGSDDTGSADTGSDDTGSDDTGASRDDTGTEAPRECSCGGGSAPGWLVIGLVATVLRRRRGVAILAVGASACVIRGPEINDTGEVLDTGDFGSTGVFVNEFMASNAATVADAGGAYPDWIELYNAGFAQVDLSGHALSDDPGDPAKWVFPAGVSIAAGGYLLVFADGDIEEGDLHASFRLAAGGESVLLFGPADDGAAPLDGVVDYPAQTVDVSWARTVDGGGAWATDATPTPGGANGD